MSSVANKPFRLGVVMLSIIMLNFLAPYTLVKPGDNV